MKSRIYIIIVVLVSIAMVVNVVPLVAVSNHSNNTQIKANSPANKPIQNLPSTLSVLNMLQDIPIQLATRAESGNALNQNSQHYTNSRSSGLYSSSGNSFLEPLGYVQNTLEMNTNQIYQGSFQGINGVVSTGIAYDPQNGLIYANSFFVNPSEVTGVLNISGVMVYSASNQSLMKVIPIEPEALSIYYDGVNGYLYVTTTSDTIVVINTTTNMIAADISIPEDTAYYMTSVPNGTVYATSSNDTIVVIHGTKVTGYIDLEYGTPYGIAYDNSNGYLYVSIPGYSNNSSNITSAGLVAIINPAKSTLINTLMPGHYVLSLAYSNGKIFGTELLSNEIVEISGSSMVGNITAKYGSFSIFTNPYNHNLYVSYIGNQKLWRDFLGSVINSSPNESFFFNSTPAQVLKGGLLIFNSSGSLTASITMETGPVWIAFNPSNGMAYMNSILPGQIVEMTGTSVNHVITTMSTPSDSYYDPYYNYLYVTDLTQGQVMVYNATGENLVSKIDTGGMPFRIAHDPSGNIVYVTNLLNASVDQITGTSITNVYNVGYLNVSFNTSAGLSLKFLIPVSITMDTLSSTLYVTTTNYMLGSGSTENDYQYLAKISTQSGQISYINSTVTAPILGLSYDPNNNQVYVDTLFGSEPVIIIANGTYNSTLTQDLNSVISISQHEPDIAIDSEYDPADNYTYVLLHNENQGPISPVDYYIMSIFPNDTLINITSIEVPVQASSLITEGLDVNGLNYDPFTNMLMISSFVYPYQAESTSSGTEYHVTGGIFFMNQTGFQGYVSTGLGTTSSQATGSNNIYVTNGASGTISTVKLVSSGLSNLTINVKPAGATLYLNGNLVQLNNGKATMSLASGNYFIEVSERGYKAYSNYIHLGYDTNLTVNVSLVSITNYGYLQGTVNPTEAIVEANGISLPVSGGSFNVSLKSGTYYVTAFANGYSSTEVTVNISTGLTSYISVNLTKVTSTYEVVGYISPYNLSQNPSVLFNGTVAFVNSTGYFIAYVPAGTYLVSATEDGYYPVSKNITVDGGMNLLVVLTKEPLATSQKTNNTTLVQAFNASITSIQNNYTAGFVGVTFNATTNSTLVITVPYSALSTDHKNLTVNQLLSSKVYINGVSYSNFSITLSSNYNVTLSIFGYKGDPVLQWYFIPYAKLVNLPLPKKAVPPTGLNPELLYGLIAVIALILVVSTAVVIQTRKKR